MYAGTRPRHSASALSKDALSSRNTEIPMAASVMMSSQLPLAPEPLMNTGRYTVRSMVANRPAFGQPPGYAYRISSAARDQPVPAQPVCSGALLLVCVLIVADQASMSWIAFLAYRSSRVRYQVSASAYAARASVRSSLQPKLGLEWEPHSTFARGFGVRDSDAYWLARMLSKADFHGCAPVWTLAQTKSSCALLTSTPGCLKAVGAWPATVPDGLVCASATAAGSSSAPTTGGATHLPLRRGLDGPLGRLGDTRA